MLATSPRKIHRPTDQFNMRLEVAVLAQLDHMAAERSTTRTDVIRTLLAAWMRDLASVVVGFPVSRVEQWATCSRTRPHRKAATSLTMEAGPQRMVLQTCSAP